MTNSPEKLQHVLDTINPNWFCTWSLFCCRTSLSPKKSTKRLCLFVEARGFFYQPTSGCPKPRRYFFSLIHFFGFLRVPESASLNPVQGIWEKILSSLSFISSIFALSRNLRSLLGLQSGGFFEYFSKKVLNCNCFIWKILQIFKNAHEIHYFVMGGKQGTFT